VEGRRGGERVVCSTNSVLAGWVDGKIRMFGGVEWDGRYRSEPHIRLYLL